jgi:hypothetical protein
VVAAAISPVLGMGLIDRLKDWWALRRLRNLPEYMEAERLYGLFSHHPGTSPRKTAAKVREILMFRHAVPEPLASFIVDDILHSLGHD